MFGTWRFILALLVVLTHIGGIGGFSAGYAVFGFYALSGYLISLIAAEKYKGRLWAFVLNRGLRIYPLYWLSCCFSLWLILTFGEKITAFHSNIMLPQTIGEIAANFFIVGLRVSESARLVPPAWAVANELIIYCVIGLFFHAGKRRNIAWLAVSAAYHLYAYKVGADRYYSVFAASLPFSVGACAYHYRNELAALLPHSQRNLALSAAVSVLAMVAGATSDSPQGLFVYINIAACFLLLHQLSHAKFHRFNSYDRFLGDLSYPMYLFHYGVGAVGFVNGFDRPSVELLAVTLPFLLALCVIVAFISNATIERLRSRIKG